MSWLVYGILPDARTDAAFPLPGVDGQPVRFVGNGSLCAAISPHTRGPTPPGIVQLRAYARLVAALHEQGTIIPLRYGCLAEEVAQVEALLAAQASAYTRLLDELAGCVELGVRLLPPAPPPLDASSPPPEKPAALPVGGADYLRARAGHYAREQTWRQERQRLAARCAAALSQWSVKSASDPPSPLAPLVSVYFLVRREAIAPFRQAFYAYSTAAQPTKLLLTGPWPPYNFVTPEHRLDLPDGNK